MPQPIRVNYIVTSDNVKRGYEDLSSAIGYMTNLLDAGHSEVEIQHIEGTFSVDIDPEMYFKLLKETDKDFWVYDGSTETKDGFKVIDVETNDSGGDLPNTLVKLRSVNEYNNVLELWLPTL